MSDETPPEVYGPLLECVCSWGQEKDVIELINDRLLSTFQETTTQVPFVFLLLTNKPQKKKFPPKISLMRYEQMYEFI